MKLIEFDIPCEFCSEEQRVSSDTKQEGDFILRVTTYFICNKCLKQLRKSNGT